MSQSWALSNFSSKKLYYYAFIIFIALFSRVSVFLIVGFILLWFLVQYAWKRRGYFLESAFTLGVIPTVLFTLTIASFGVLPTIFKAWDVAHQPKFIGWHTFSYFMKVLVVSLQMYPLVWVFGLFKRHLLRTQLEWLHFGWILYYLLFLIIGKGALWNRYLLPIVPSVIFISIRPLIELRKQRAFVFWGVFTLILLFNVVPLIVQIANPAGNSFLSYIMRLFY